MGNTVRTLTLLFNQEIAPYEVSMFRGCILDAMKDKSDVLLHNHPEHGFRYSYPLVQYKRIRGHAALVCVNMGSEAIVPLFNEKLFDFKLGERPVQMEVESVRPQSMHIQTWNDEFKYNIRKWIPLNTENYKAYQQMEGLVEKMTFLEKILTGNILSFAKGIDVHFDKEVTCKLLKLSDPFIVKVKGTRVMAFDATFSTNVSLPDYIGLGKHPSFGFGTIHKAIRHEKEESVVDNINTI